MLFLSIVYSLRLKMEIPIWYVASHNSFPVTVCDGVCKETVGVNELVVTVVYIDV